MKEGIGFAKDGYGISKEGWDDLTTIEGCNI